MMHGAGRPRAVYERRGAQREPTESTVHYAVMQALRERVDAQAAQRELSIGRALDPDNAYRLGA